MLFHDIYIVTCSNLSICMQHTYQNNLEVKLKSELPKNMDFLIASIEMMKQDLFNNHESKLPYIVGPMPVGLHCSFNPQ